MESIDCFERDHVARINDNMRSVDLCASGEDGNLLKRKLGEKIYLNLRNELRVLPRGGVLLLDFRRVKFATSSCLKEILRSFDELRNYEFEGKFLLLRVNLRNEELIDCLNCVIRDRGTVVPAMDEKNNWFLLGELSKALQDTLEFIKRKDGTTSAQVSRHFDIPLSAASNRLKQLHEMKLIRREEETISSSGGRQYIYKPLSL